MTRLYIAQAGRFWYIASTFRGMSFLKLYLKSLLLFVGVSLTSMCAFAQDPASSADKSSGQQIDAQSENSKPKDWVSIVEEEIQKRKDASAPRIEENLNRKFNVIETLEIIRSYNLAVDAYQKESDPAVRRKIIQDMIETFPGWKRYMAIRSGVAYQMIKGNKFFLLSDNRNNISEMFSSMGLRGYLGGSSLYKYVTHSSNGLESMAQARKLIDEINRSFGIKNKYAKHRYFKKMTPLLESMLKYNQAVDLYQLLPPESLERNRMIAEAQEAFSTVDPEKIKELLDENVRFYVARGSPAIHSVFKRMGFETDIQEYQFLNHRHATLYPADREIIDQINELVGKPNSGRLNSFALPIPIFWPESNTRPLFGDNSIVGEWLNQARRYFSTSAGSEAQNQVEVSGKSEASDGGNSIDPSSKLSPEDYIHNSKQWNKMTDLYHEQISGVQKEKVWREKLLPIWGLDAQSHALNDIKGMYLGIAKNMPMGVYAMMHRNFIEKYKDQLKLPEISQLPKSLFGRKHIDRYDALYLTLNYIQNDLNVILRDKNIAPEFSQKVSEYIDWLQTGERAPVFSDIARSLGRASGKLDLTDARDLTFAQYLYYLHITEEKGSWKKFKIAAAVRYKARKLFAAEMEKASRDAKVTDLFAEKFKVGTDKGLFGLDNIEFVRSTIETALAYLDTIDLIKKTNGGSRVLRQKRSETIQRIQSAILMLPHVEHGKYRKKLNDKLTFFEGLQMAMVSSKSSPEVENPVSEKPLAGLSQSQYLWTLLTVGRTAEQVEDLKGLLKYYRFDISATYPGFQALLKPFNDGFGRKKEMTKIFLEGAGIQKGSLDGAVQGYLNEWLDIIAGGRSISRDALEVAKPYLSNAEWGNVQLVLDAETGDYEKFIKSLSNSNVTNDFKELALRIVFINRHNHLLTVLAQEEHLKPFLEEKFDQISKDWVKERTSANLKTLAILSKLVSRNLVESAIANEDVHPGAKRILSSVLRDGSGSADVVQQGFVDFSKMHKFFSDRVNDVSEKIGQIRALYTLGEGRRFLPNVIRDVEGSQKKTRLASFLKFLIQTKPNLEKSSVEKEKTVPLISISDLLRRMEIWNEKKLSEYRNQRAEIGTLGQSVLHQYFSYLTLDQRKILEKKYMKHEFFSLPPIDFHNAIELLNRDINGHQASKNSREVAGIKERQISKINRYYDQYVALSKVTDRPEVVTVGEVLEPEDKNSKKTGSENKQSARSPPNSKEFFFTRHTSDWIWYYIVDKAIPMDLRDKSIAEIANDPRMQSYFKRHVVIPSMVMVDYIEQTPEDQLPPELWSNDYPKPPIFERLRNGIDRFWKEHIVAEQPEFLEEKLSFLGLDNQIALLELEASQKPFTKEDFAKFEKEILEIDESDPKAKARKEIYERFKYEIDFKNLELFKPEKAEELKQILLITHHRGQKKTYAKYKAVTVARAWIERNLLKDMPFIMEFREIYSEMISAKYAILGVENDSGKEASSPHHDLEQINKNRIRIGTSILSDAVKNELHAKKSDFTIQEMDFYYEYLKNRGIVVPESGKTDYLRFALDQGFHPKIIHMLVRHGFDLNKSDRSGNTAWSLWIKNYQLIASDASRKEAYFRVLQAFKQDKKVNFHTAHFAENITMSEFISRYISQREYRKPILEMLQIRDVNYTNPIIEMIQRYNTLGERLDYSKVLEHVKSGVDIFDSYFDLSGHEQRQTQLHKILEALEREPGSAEEKVEIKNKVAEIIFAAFENNPKPGMNGRLKELALINHQRIGGSNNEFMLEADGHKKHVFDVQAEIYQRYAMISPGALLEYPKLFDRFVYLSRQLSSGSFEKFLNAVFKLSVQQKAAIFNYYSNDPKNNLNTYNRSLTSQAIYAEVDVSYLRQMKEHGADFTIQNNRFIGHDVDGKEKIVSSENHHFDFMLKHVKHFKNKENARKVIQFLIDEVPGKTYRKPIVATYAKNFGAAMREFGFTAQEALQFAEKINTRLGDSMLAEAKPQIVANIRFGYEKVEIKDFTKPVTQLEVALSKAQARDMLLNESFASNAQIQEFVNEILQDPIKKPIFENILKSMSVELGDPAEFLKDEKIRRFLERGRFVHHYGEPNTEEKRTMFLEYFALSLKELNGRIKNAALYNESMTRAASPEVLMFGKRVHLAKDIALIVTPLKGTKSEKTLQAFNRWNALYPTRKIDTPRMWNKHHKKAGMPNFDQSMKILAKDKITPESLGIYVAKERAKQSKMIIATIGELRALIVAHNQNHPNEKILLQSNYEKLSGKYGYPSYITLTKRMGSIDWKYATGQTSKVSKNLRARPSKFVVKNMEEFRELILKHNADHPKKQINSMETYKKYAPAFKYMSFNALRKKIGSIDWAYVTGESAVIASKDTNRKPYSIIGIRSELGLRELILAHNRLYPNELIHNRASYDVQARKYGYPELRSIAQYIPTVDWKFVTGATDVSAAVPRKSRTIYRNIKTEAQLRELILKHNSRAPIEDNIASRETYHAVAEKYKLPSLSALHNNIKVISWKYVTGQVDQPEANRFGKRVYERPRAPNVLGTGPAALFAPGGLEWFVYTWRSMMSDMGAELSKLTRVLQASVHNVIWELQNRARGVQVAKMQMMPDPDKKDSEGKSYNDERKIETDLTKHTVKYRGKEVTIAEIKSKIHAYNERALPEAKITGMRKLDKHQVAAGIPERHQVVELLKMNNLPSEWLYSTPLEYNLGEAVRDYKAKYPLAKIVISRGRLWTGNELLQQKAIYNRTVPMEEKIVGIKSWDKYQAAGKLLDRSLIPTVLKNEGRTTAWLFGAVQSTYNLEQELIKFYTANPGKEPYVYRGRIWTAEYLMELKESHNESAEEKDKVKNAHDMGRINKFPPRHIVNEILLHEGKTMSWLLNKTHTQVVGMFNGQPVSKKQLEKIIQAEMKKNNIKPESEIKAPGKNTKSGKSGNVYSTVIPGLPQAAQWIANGGPQRAYEAVESIKLPTYDYILPTVEQIKTTEASKIIDLLEKVPAGKIAMEGERYTAAVEQIDRKLKDWYQYRNNATAARFRQKTLERLGTLANKSHGTTIFDQPHGLHQKAFVEGGKFAIALIFADLGRQIIDPKADFDDFMTTLKHLPVEMVRLVTFSTSSGYAVAIASKIEELMYKKMGARMESHAMQMLAERGASKALVNRTVARKFVMGQIGFLAGMVMNKIIWDKGLQDEKFWQNIAYSSTSFLGAQILVKTSANGARMLYSTVKYGTRGFRVMALEAGPGGWLVAAAELGLELLISPYIEGWMRSKELQTQLELQMRNLSRALSGEITSTRNLKILPTECAQFAVRTPESIKCVSSQLNSVLAQYIQTEILSDIQELQGDAAEDESEALKNHTYIVPAFVEESYVLDSTSGAHGFTYPAYQAMMKDLRTKHYNLLDKQKDAYASAYADLKDSTKNIMRNMSALKTKRIKALEGCNMEMTMVELEKCIQIGSSAVQAIESEMSRAFYHNADFCMEESWYERMFSSVYDGTTLGLELSGDLTLDEMIAATRQRGKNLIATTNAQQSRINDSCTYDAVTAATKEALIGMIEVMVDSVDHMRLNANGQLTKDFFAMDYSPRITEVKVGSDVVPMSFIHPRTPAERSMTLENHEREMMGNSLQQISVWVPHALKSGIKDEQVRTELAAYLIQDVWNDMDHEDFSGKYSREIERAGTNHSQLDRDPAQFGVNLNKMKFMVRDHLTDRHIQETKVTRDNYFATKVNLVQMLAKEMESDGFFVNGSYQSCYEVQYYKEAYSTKTKNLVTYDSNALVSGKPLMYNESNAYVSCTKYQELRNRVQQAMTAQK